jgi:hypothetical protein
VNTQMLFWVSHRPPPLQSASVRQVRTSRQPLDRSATAHSVSRRFI